MRYSHIADARPALLRLEAMRILIPRLRDELLARVWAKPAHHPALADRPPLDMRCADAKSDQLRLVECRD